MRLSATRCENHVLLLQVTEKIEENVLMRPIYLLSFAITVF